MADAPVPGSTDGPAPEVTRSVHHGNRNPARLLGSWLRYKQHTAMGKRQMRTDKFIKKGTSYKIPYVGHRGPHSNP